MSARVGSALVRSRRLSASWLRAGSRSLIRTCVGRASSSTKPATYSPISPTAVGFAPTAAETPIIRNAHATCPYSRCVVRYSRAVIARPPQGPAHHRGTPGYPGLSTPGSYPVTGQSPTA